MRPRSSAVKVAMVASATAVLTAMGGGSALAEGTGVPVDQANTLLTHAYTYDNATGVSTTSTCSTIGWKTVKVDSPIDNNSNALAVNICPSTDTTSDYALAWTHQSINIDSLAGDVQNLSFDFKSSLVAGGVPRISVQFNNGDVAYLNASTCDNAFAVAPSWSRADFTGATSNCSFDVFGTTAGTYAADGTNSAWAVYAQANPNQFVTSAYMVFDQAGRFHVDRIALGTDYLYNDANTLGYPCEGSEARC